MLVRDYVFTLAGPECNHSAETVNALATLTDDTGDVLPYLNTVLKKARYDPATTTLIFQHEGHRIVLHNREVAMSGLEDEDEARKVLTSLLDLINDTWERRAQIEPNHSPTRDLKVFDVYRALPGSNCRECGEPTCLAFATKLVRDDVEVTACRPLFAARNAQHRESLLALLRDCGRDTTMV